MKRRVKYPTPGSLPAPVKPYQSINVEKDYSTNEVSVTAQISLDGLIIDNGRVIENAAFGLALDGSRSMKASYGDMLTFLPNSNKVEPVAKTMLKFLAQYSGTNSVELAYWAVGPDGKEIEEAGNIPYDQIDSLKDSTKKDHGR